MTSGAFGLLRVEIFTLNAWIKWMLQLALPFTKRQSFQKKIELIDRPEANKVYIRSCFPIVLVLLAVALYSLLSLIAVFTGMRSLGDGGYFGGLIIIFFLLAIPVSLMAIPVLISLSVFLLKTVINLYFMSISIWNKTITNTDRDSIHIITAYYGSVLNLCVVIPIIGLSCVKFNLHQFFGTPRFVTDWSPFTQPLAITQPLLNFILIPNQGPTGGLTPAGIPQFFFLLIGHLLVLGFILGLSWRLASVLKIAWWRTFGAILSTHLAMGALGIIINRLTH
jgi:hypothetical protein